MSRSLIPFILVAVSVCLAFTTRATAAGLQGSATGKPEFDQLVAGYEAQEQAIDSEIEPQLKAARERYTADLEALIAKLN